MALQPAVLKVIEHGRRSAQTWSTYGSSYGLWAPRKPDADKRLIERAPSAVYFDTRLTAFSRLAESIDSVVMVKDIGFLRLDCAPVAVACKQQALKLKAEFGHALREIAHRRLTDALHRMRDVNAALNAPTDTLVSARAPVIAHDERTGAAVINAGHLHAVPRHGHHASRCRRASRASWAPWRWC